MCLDHLALSAAGQDREAQLALQSTRKSVETRLAFCKEKEMMFKKRQEELRKHVLENQPLALPMCFAMYISLYIEEFTGLLSLRGGRFWLK